VIEITFTLYKLILSEFVDTIIIVNDNRVCSELPIHRYSKIYLTVYYMINKIENYRHQDSDNSNVSWTHWRNKVPVQTSIHARHDRWWVA